MQKPKQIVIVGGGITGLSAAWYLTSHLKESVKVTLIEAEPRLGGKVITRVVDLDDGQRLKIEGGADSFDARSSEVWRLAEELGLNESVIEFGHGNQNLYVLDGGKAVNLPLSPAAFIRSRLLTWREKFRVIEEALLPVKVGEEDESLATFVSRRFGKTLLDKWIGPLLAGQYNRDLECQSLLATFPELRDMEKEHGGLVRSALRGLLQSRKADPGKLLKARRLKTFRQGTQELVDRLAHQLTVEVRTNTSALEIHRQNRRYQVVLSTGEAIRADALILACPANVSSEILKPAAPESAILLKQIRHQNIGTATLAYRSAEVTIPFGMDGLIIPRREGRKLDAVALTAAKPNFRAPKGYQLVKVFFGGGDPRLAEQPDKKIVKEVRAELRAMLGIEAEPVHTEVFRWLHAFPQMDVGHLELVNLIEGQLPDGVFLAGSSYRGVEVQDCIHQGYDAAEFCLQYLEAS